MRDDQRKLFATLGEAYYASRNDEDADERLALLVRRIDEVQERIKAVTAELDALNDKRRCPACEAVVDINAKFCPACGAKMPEAKPAQEADPDQPQEARCENCGAPRQGEARFCAVCGQPFEAEAPKPTVEINWPEAGAEPSAAEEPPRDKTAKFDPNAPAFAKAGASSYGKFFNEIVRRAGRTRLARRRMSRAEPAQPIPPFARSRISARAGWAASVPFLLMCMAASPPPPSALQGGPQASHSS